MARTGYKITVYLDDNPNSPTYGETYTARTLDSGACPVAEDDLVMVGNQCEIDISGLTGYRIITYYNTTTGEYTEVREEDPECEPSTSEEQWVNSGSPYCETTEQGLNTGYMLQLQVQVNQNLPNYGATRYSRYKSPECVGNGCASWNDIQTQCHIAVNDCVATFDGTEDVTQIDVNPLSETYNQTRTINRESSGNCQNCTETTFSWVDVGEMCGDDDMLCGEGLQQTPTTKYMVRQKYKTIGSGTPVAMGEYQITVVEEESEDCGYIRPITAWTATTEYICDYETHSKYVLEVLMISYDSGVTWSVVQGETRRGDLIMEHSYDCGEPMYRWVPTDDYVCVDNGDDGKIIYIDSNGKLASATPCSVSSVLEAGDGRRMTAVTQDISLPYTDTYKVGNCIDEIGENAFSGMSSGMGVTGSRLHLGDYTEIINAETLKWYNRRSIDFPRNVNTIIEPFAISERNYDLRNLVMNCSQVPSLSATTSRPTNPLGLYGATYGTNAYGLAIWVPNDLYDEYCSASGWINYAGRDNCKLMPMNNDNISYKVIEMFESDFTRWSYFIPDGENSSTVTADECRYGVSVLTSITFTDKVTSFSVIPTENYNKLVNLKKVNFSKNLTSIPSNAFRDCPNLTRVDIPNSVTTIGSYAFFGCSSLWRIAIGSGVTTISGNAFAGCRSLTRLIVYASTPPTMENGAFSSSSLLHIYVPAESVDLYKSASGWSSYSDIITAIN